MPFTLRLWQWFFDVLDFLCAPVYRHIVPVFGFSVAQDNWLTENTRRGTVYVQHELFGLTLVRFMFARDAVMFKLTFVDQGL